jgi:hypothetical protein
MSEPVSCQYLPIPKRVVIVTDSDGETHEIKVADRPDMEELTQLMLISNSVEQFRERISDRYGDEDEGFTGPEDRPNGSSDAGDGG